MLNTRIKFGILCFLLLVFSNNIFAQQEVVELTLEDAIATSLKNNKQLKLSDLEQKSALFDVEKVKRQYMPNVSLDVTGMITNVPLNSFGIKLQQGQIQQSDFNPSELNSPDMTDNLLSKLTVVQPIVNMDLVQYKNAASAKVMALEKQQDKISHFLKKNISHSYAQLQLLYDVTVVLEQAKKTAEANQKLVQDNVDEGYLQQSDLISVKLRISEIDNQILEVDNNIDNISDQISLMMGADLGTRYVPSSNSTYANDETIDSYDFDHRSDIQAKSFEIGAMNSMLEAKKKTNYPRLNAIATYEHNNDLSFGESQHGYAVMLNMSWNIFDGKRNKTEVEKARIALSKSELELEQMKDQSKMEIEFQKRQLELAQNQVEVAENSITNAKEKLKIVKNRFDEGLEKTSELLMAETELSSSKLDLQQAKFMVQKSIIELEFLTERK